MAYILVIDDNAVIRDVVKFTLQNHYSITLANDGKEGLKLAESSHFDLIITDVSMPDMSGLEVVKELRKIEAYSTTPILVLTANMEDYQEKSKESGATGWIAKPFEPGRLLETVDGVLKNKA
jgi:two-component system chemotaxis response regulator CheY